MREAEPGISRRFGLLEDSRKNGYGTQRYHQEQNLGQEALDLTSAVLASSSSEDQLRNRLNKMKRPVSGLGCVFRMLTSSDKFLRRDASPEEMS